MPSLLLASNNPGKLEEIRAILAGVSIPILIPSQIGLSLDVLEDGSTYAENAARKALAYARALQESPLPPLGRGESPLPPLGREKSLLPPFPRGAGGDSSSPPFSRGAGGDSFLVLADDSGLEVDALGGAPGLHSARYAGAAPRPAGARFSDADRRAFLLQALAASGAPRPWRAHFHCTVALAAVGPGPGGALAAGEPLYAEGDCPGEIIPTERGSNGFGYDPIFLLPTLGRTMAELSMDEKNRLSHRALAVQAAAPHIKTWLEQLTRLD